MDSKKMMSIIVVIVLAVAAVGLYLVMKDDKDSLKVVYLNKGSYETIMVAGEKGFFNELDYDVEHLLVSGSGQNAVDALLTGEADIAATGEGPAIETLNKCGDDIVILCSYNIVIGGHVWVAHPGSGIAANDDPQVVANSMKGKTIGLISGSTTESMFKRWCDAYSLVIDGGTDGVKKVTFMDGASLLEAFASGEIDVLGASEPYPTMAIELGGKKIGSSADINANSVSVLMTTKEKYEANEDKMKSFVKAMHDATAYINENEDECIEYCANRIGWTIAEQRSSFSRTTFEVSYSDLVIDSLFSTADAKGHTKVTMDVLISSCPLRSYLDSLASP